MKIYVDLRLLVNKNKRKALVFALPLSIQLTTINTYPVTKKIWNKISPFLHNICACVFRPPPHIILQEFFISIFSLGYWFANNLKSPIYNNQQKIK